MRYFQLNASTPVIDRKHQDFLRYMAKRKGHVTLIKAASYLLNPVDGSSFGTVRQMILKNSIAVVQDDSGVPIKYFRSWGGSWTLTENILAPLRSFVPTSKSNYIDSLKITRCCRLLGGIPGDILPVDRL